MRDWHNDIEKYQKGLLSEKEMHALEKRALSDPFLADALEGAESIDAAQFAADVQDLEHKLLKRKVNFWPYGIAASVLLFITIAYVLYKPLVEKPASEKLAQVKTDSTKVIKNKNQLAVDSVKNPQKELLTFNPPKAKPKAERKKLSKAEEQVAAAPSAAASKVTGEAAQGLAVPNSIIVESEAIDEVAAEKTSAPISLAEIQQDKAADVTSERAKKASAYATQPLVANKNMKTLSGKVLSTEDQSPIPGVSIIVPGITKGIITDAEGNYTFTVADTVRQLQFSFIGLQTKTVDIGADLRNDVQLSADVTQLSEVVVVGYGEAKQTDDAEEKPIKMASPVGGRRAYNKYLEKNLTYPEKAIENKIEGKVTIQFIVNLKGTLTDFAVIRSLGYGCDEEVIRLVKEGPKWNPSMQADVPLESTVRVRLKFKLPR